LFEDEFSVSGTEQHTRAHTNARTYTISDYVCPNFATENYLSVPFLLVRPIHVYVGQKNGLSRSLKLQDRWANDALSIL